MPLLIIRFQDSSFLVHFLLAKSHFFLLLVVRASALGGWPADTFFVLRFAARSVAVVVLLLLVEIVLYFLIDRLEIDSLSVAKVPLLPLLLAIWTI